MLHICSNIICISSGIGFFRAKEMSQILVQKKGVQEGRLSFFHHFCEQMSSLYEEYIYMPQGDDLLRVTEKYASMGFPGCVGSTDCVHFFWDRCPHNVRFLHSGKEGKPTVAYSMIVDHMRRIRSVTAGHPGARNDKSISQYDKSQQDMRTGRLYRDETFTLFEAFGQEGQTLECE
jgi:hypothetical protein